MDFFLNKYNRNLLYQYMRLIISLILFLVFHSIIIILFLLIANNLIETYILNIITIYDLYISLPGETAPIEQIIEPIPDPSINKQIDYAYTIIGTFIIVWSTLMIIGMVVNYFDLFDGYFYPSGHSTPPTSPPSDNTPPPPSSGPTPPPPSSDPIQDFIDSNNLDEIEKPSPRRLKNYYRYVIDKSYISKPLRKQKPQKILDENYKRFFKHYKTKGTTYKP